MKIVDLTHTIEEDMTLYPDTPIVSIKANASVEKNGFKVSMLKIQTHVGTHIDCQTHFYKNGRNTDDEDIDIFYGKAITIDCSNLSENDEISLNFIKNINLNNYDYLLLYTGWDKYWKTQKYYSFPSISKELAILIKNSDLKGVGVDTISADAMNTSDCFNHLQILYKDKIIVENLKNLDLLLGKECEFSCMPLKLKNTVNSL